MRTAILLLLSTRAVTLPAQPAPRVLDEYRVKAAFVYRFPQFVTWPAAALANATTLDVCIVRPSPFGAELAQLVRDEVVDGRAMRVREIAGADALDGCHALFVGARVLDTREVLQAAASRHILTVGESRRFLDDGGIIALKVTDQRVRFDVDTDNARRAGLRIAAQLLNLAAAVRGGRS